MDVDRRRGLYTIEAFAAHVRIIPNDVGTGNVVIVVQSSTLRAFDRRELETTATTWS